MKNVNYGNLDMNEDCKGKRMYTRIGTYTGMKMSTASLN